MKTTRHPHPLFGRVRKGATLLLLAGVLASGASAADTTLAEMLELGIYSEETKGDLSAAMKLYEQIVAESAADRVLAAQALLRLALCHDKQGDHAAATQAFERLTRDFADQKDLVALAQEYLAAGFTLLPAPWGESEEMQYVVKLPGGASVGVARYSVQAARRDDHPVWRLRSHLIAGASQWSEVEVDAATFKPLHCSWKIQGIGHADTTYAPGRAEVRMPGADEPRTIELAGPVFDNEQVIQLIRRLPLAPGWKSNLQVFVGISGGNIIPIPLSTSGPERVSVPAGEFDCWRVDLKVGPNTQSFWYATEGARPLVKFEAGGARVELERVIRPMAGGPVPYRDAALGFSLTLPEGWMAHRREAADDTRHSTIVLLSPHTSSGCNVKVEAVTNFDATTVATPRAFADYKIGQGRRHVKSLAVREDSWRETTIAGQPAVSFLADLEQQGPPVETFHGVYAIVDGMAVECWFACPPSDFDALLQQFESIVASYRSP